jgi:RpiB/LacA/LacB family sugar-phosphate isomerase
MFNEKEKKIAYISCDHAAFKMKETLKDHLEGLGLDVRDLGCFNEDPCDYPDVAREIGEKIIEHPDAVGVLLCGSGSGVCMGVNRFKMVRAANCVTPEMAEMTRKHNNANVLCMGSRIVEEATAKEIVDTFLATDFEKGEERHVRRVDKLKMIG